MKIIVPLILIGFMGACTHKTNNYNFENLSSVKIDESKVILTRFPLQLEEINDSVVATINSFHHLSFYNIKSGENFANFSVSDINFDSLIKATYQKKYEGKRKYTYDKGQEISGIGERLSLFQYINNNFYIYVNTLAQVDYLNDSTELLKLNENEEIKQAKKMYKNVNLCAWSYMPFLIIIDDKFNLKEAIPLYDVPLLEENNYVPLFERTFYVDGDNLHVFLFKTTEGYEAMRSSKDVSFYFTAVTDINDETKTHFLLNNNTIDYSDFSLNDYLESSVKFIKRNGELNYFNGKEICEVTSGKRTFSKTNLKTNEWINNFYINEDDYKIIMINNNKDKKKNPTAFEKNYAIDSISYNKIRVFDLRTSQWISEKNLIPGFSYPYLVTKNKIIGFDKDKQNYYFKYIKYNEN